MVHLSTSQRKAMHEWCKHHFVRFRSKEMQPPSLPDLNPTDFCGWSMLEEKACPVLHTNVSALKQLHK